MERERGGATNSTVRVGKIRGDHLQNIHHWIGQVIARICDSYHRTEPVKPATSASASVIRFLSPIWFLAGPHVPTVPCTQLTQPPVQQSHRHGCPGSSGLTHTM